MHLISAFACLFKGRRRRPLGLPALAVAPWSSRRCLRLRAPRPHLSIAMSPTLPLPADAGVEPGGDQVSPRFQRERAHPASSGRRTVSRETPHGAGVAPISRTGPYQHGDCRASPRPAGKPEAARSAYSPSPE